MYIGQVSGTLIGALVLGKGYIWILTAHFYSLFPESGGINFGLWFVFATPAMLLSLFLSWTYLSLLYCDDRLAAPWKFLSISSLVHIHADSLGNNAGLFF